MTDISAQSVLQSGHKGVLYALIDAFPPTEEHLLAISPNLDAGSIGKT